MSDSNILTDIPEHGARPGEVPASFPSTSSKSSTFTDIQSIIDRALQENRSCLMEHECKEILEGIGIHTTGGIIATSEESAVRAGRAIGYPVVLKIVSPDVTHKSDGGGVKLNLNDDAAVRTAFREIMQAFRHRNVIGVSVQKMAEPGIRRSSGSRMIPALGTFSCSAWAGSL